MGIPINVIIVPWSVIIKEIFLIKINIPSGVVEIQVGGPPISIFSKNPIKASSPVITRNNNGA